MIVATVMFVTTSLLTLVMYYVWVLPYAFPLLFIIVFGGIDLAFWACTSGSSSIFNNSDNPKISPWGMGSMLYWHCDDLLYESLAS